MRLPRPKSLSGILLLGFVLVALPLLLAIGRAASQLNEFADESSTLVIRGVQSTDQNQQLRKQLATVERSAKVYRVIGEAELLDAYNERTKRLNQMLDEMATAAADQSRFEQIKELKLNLNAFDTVLKNSDRTSEELNDALESFSTLSELVDEMSRSSNQFIDQGLNTLQRSASRVQRQLAMQTALLVPFTVLVIVIFTALLARPLRQIDRAISALGDGHFSKPIDVSGPEDLRLLGQQLEWLRERLMEQEREKDKFLRHMSHELKTPLANIREGTELLIDGAVGELYPPQKEVADILRENSLSLQKLIENLLSFSAWQAKLSELQVEDLPLSQLIRNIIDQQKLTLTARNIRVKLSLTEMTILADKNKIQMVVDNLLSNAIKFSPDGGTIFVMTKPINNGYVIEIADEGPGISKRDRTRIFDPFYQGSNRQSGHVKGTGIGLSVVKECINAHGGQIAVIDSQHAGAHFRVTLPTIPNAVAAA